MPPEIVEAIAPLIAMLGIGTFILFGMKMRLTDKLAQQKDHEALELITDAIDRLMDETHGMHEEIIELQERIDFHERLLTQPKKEEAER